MRWNLQIKLFLFAVSLPNIILLTFSSTTHANIPNSATMSVVSAIGNIDSQIRTEVAQNVPAPPQNPQPNPNQQRFPQPAPVPAPLPTESQPSVEPPVTPNPTTTPSSQSVEVQKIQVTGSTVFSTVEFNPITQPWEKRQVSIEQLKKVADSITQLYLDKGYITSRAILAEQAVQSGVVEIRIIEGRLAKIEVEGTSRINPNYLRSRIMLGAAKPLNTSKLEDQLRLLRADPLFKNIEASLKAGNNVGESILIVRAIEANPFDGSVGADNYSPPSVGSERFGVNLSYRNVTGIGDQVSGSYYRTMTGGADIFDFSYRLPLNAMNGTLQFRAAPNRNKVTQEPFNVFNITGQTDLYEISYRQPFVRSPQQELALSLGFSYQDGQTFVDGQATPFGFGPDAQGRSNTRTIKFGQDYLRRDVAGAWSLRSLFSLGVGELDATINNHPTPDGRFFSWLGQIQRVQVLNKDNFLILQTDVQLTPNSLLPSQQFVIGGGQSVRGYRQNIRSGDNGVRFSIENRFTAIRDKAGNSTFQLAPFFDLGAVWNHATNPNQIPGETFLAGGGLGLIWQPMPRLNFRLDYSQPIIEVKDKGNNAQDNAFYFSVNYQL